VWGATSLYFQVVWFIPVQWALHFQGTMTSLATGRMTQNQSVLGERFAELGIIYLLINLFMYVLIYCYYL
jgi:hypothetical protein